MQQIPASDHDGVDVTSEAALLRLAEACGTRSVPGFSSAEHALLAAARHLAPEPEAHAVEACRVAVRAGHDPLGGAFVRLRSAEVRRASGATYTPEPLVTCMLEWLRDHAARVGAPARVVDPGAGSARYLVAAGRYFPEATLVGVELDAAAAVLARGHLAAAGFANRAHVVVGDYRAEALAPALGPTFFVGNPPYVRHHLIPPAWKRWLVEEAARLGHGASQLAGLHVYFFLRTAACAQAGDAGAFVTAAEWLDVNYGRLVRELFLGPLGGHDLLVLEPTIRAFPDAATTAAVTTFVVGSRPAAVRVSRVGELTGHPLGAGRPVRRERLAAEPRWSLLLRAPRAARDGHVELGELCRVHRGAVTGANAVWVTDASDTALPESVLLPSVTRARELFVAGRVLRDGTALRRVIDLPRDLDIFEGEERKQVDRFLRQAERRGAHTGYIARHRAAWWSVGLREPPPILASYMARRPPAFVRNRAGAHYINIAHGIYPREPMTESMLLGLATHLATATSLSDGRTYAGGLTKFEPREMERLLVPTPERLADEQPELLGT